MTAARKIKQARDWRIPKRDLRLVAASQRMDAIWAPGRRAEMYFVLKGRKPVPVSFARHVRWMQQQNKNGRLTMTIAKERAGQYTVSTIFLGLNHGYWDRPVLFETMAWTTADGKFRDEQYRYYTWDEAMKGHKQYAQRLRMQLVQP